MVLSTAPLLGAWKVFTKLLTIILRSFFETTKSYDKTFFEMVRILFFPFFNVDNPILPNRTRHGCWIKRKRNILEVLKTFDQAALVPGTNVETDLVALVTTSPTSSVSVLLIQQP